MAKIHLSFLLSTLLWVGSAVGQPFAGTDFSKADSTARYWQGENLHDLPGLSRKLTAGLTTDVEQFRSIYRWVCSNIENDFRSSIKNEEKRLQYYQDSAALTDWNQYFGKEVYRRLFEEKRTVCTGYAFLVRELALEAGINCQIVDGYGRSGRSHVEELGIPNHSWNAVKLSGTWYLCDPIWSSGTNYRQGAVSTFVFDFNPGYFLTEPSYFLKSHFPLNPAWSLLDAPPNLDHFVHGPLLYSKTYQLGLNPTAPKAFRLKVEKGDSIDFVYTSYAPVEYTQVDFLLINGYYKKVLTPAVVESTNNLLVLRQRFIKRGEFDLHLMINGDTAVTYVVEVN